MSSVYVPDAGRAVAAALAAPAGTYNVCDDAPVPLAEYVRVVARSLGAPRPWRLPVALGPMLFGEVAKFFFRSLRVSNRRFRDAAGWRPDVTSVAEGWPRIAAQWRGPASGAAAGG